MGQHAARGIGRAIVLAIALALGGCMGAQDKAPEPVTSEQAAAERGLGGAPAEKRMPHAESASSPADASKPSETRHIIRRAEVSLLVSSVPGAVEEVRALAKSKGGYVSSESLDTSSGQIPNGSLTLRVPVARFDETLAAFGSLGEVQSRHVSAEDVTLEFVDTESRLRNLQREEAQFLKVLERSGSIRDVLAVERELSRVRGEIEQTTGRLRQLGNLIDLATITVNLSARSQQAVTSPWDLAPVVRNAWQDAQEQLAGSTARALSGLVWVGAYLVPLAVPSLLLYLLIGWILARLLVGRVAWLTPARFRMGWLLVGLSLLVLAYPPLLLLLLALSALAFAASKVPALRRRWEPPGSGPS